MDNMDTSSNSTSSAINDNHFILNIISEFEIFPVLWDTNHPASDVDEVTLPAWKIILNKYQQKYPNACLEEVQHFFKGLQRQYFKERVKLQYLNRIGMGSEDVVKQTFPFFNALKFLDAGVNGNGVKKKRSLKTVQKTAADAKIAEQELSPQQSILTNSSKQELPQQSILATSSKKESPQQTILDNSSKQESSQRNLLDNSYKQQEPSQKTSLDTSFNQRQLPSTQVRQADEVLIYVYDNDKRERGFRTDDEFSIFASNIEISLRNMEKSQSLICRDIINTAIYFGQVGYFDDDKHYELMTHMYKTLFNKN